MPQSSEILRTPRKYSEVLLALVGLFGFISGAYWVGKTVSYSLFYEDMVQATVVEMVKPEALK